MKTKMTTAIKRIYGLI